MKRSELQLEIKKIDKELKKNCVLSVSERLNLENKKLAFEERIKKLNDKKTTDKIDISEFISNILEDKNSMSSVDFIKLCRTKLSKFNEREDKSKATLAKIDYLNSILPKEAEKKTPKVYKIKSNSVSSMSVADILKDDNLFPPKNKVEKKNEKRFIYITADFISSLTKKIEVPENFDIKTANLTELFNDCSFNNMDSARLLQNMKCSAVVKAEENHSVIWSK